MKIEMKSLNERILGLLYNRHVTKEIDSICNVNYLINVKFFQLKHVNMEEITLYSACANIFVHLSIFNFLECVR